MSIYYFLEEDLLALKILIEKNIKEIKSAKLDMATAASQTSETWHDNFGFEDGTRNLDKLMNYTQELVDVLEHAEIFPIGEDKIIGTNIFLTINNIKFKKIISSYLNITNNNENISYACPVAQDYIEKNFPESKLKL